jgi:hypothetical protein
MANWSQGDDEQLRELAKLGLSGAQIAERLLRAQAAVRGRAAKLGIAIARDMNTQRSR